MLNIQIHSLNKLRNHSSNHVFDWFKSWHIIRIDQSDGSSQGVKGGFYSMLYVLGVKLYSPGIIDVSMLSDVKIEHLHKKKCIEYHLEVKLDLLMDFLSFSIFSFHTQTFITMWIGNISVLLREIVPGVCWIMRRYIVILLYSPRVIVIMIPRKLYFYSSNFTRFLYKYHQNSNIVKNSKSSTGRNFPEIR